MRYPCIDDEESTLDRFTCRGCASRLRGQCQAYIDREDKLVRETRDARRETLSHPAREVRVVKWPGVGEYRVRLGEDLCSISVPRLHRSAPAPQGLGIDDARFLLPTMSQWLERHVSLQRIEIASTAVLASIATAAVIFGSFALRQRIATEDLKASIPSLSDKHHAEDVCHCYAALFTSFQQCSVRLTTLCSAH
jgi:hypothetical protein